MSNWSDSVWTNAARNERKRYGWPPPPAWIAWTTALWEGPPPNVRWLAPRQRTSSGRGSPVGGGSSQLGGPLIPGTPPATGMFTAIVCSSLCRFGLLVLG